MSKKPTYYVAERQGRGAIQMMQRYHRQAMPKRLRGGEFVLASMGFISQWWRMFVPHRGQRNKEVKALGVPPHHL